MLKWTIGSSKSADENEQRRGQKGLRRQHSARRRKQSFLSRITDSNAQKRSPLMPVTEISTVVANIIGEEDQERFNLSPAPRRPYLSSIKQAIVRKMPTLRENEECSTKNKSKKQGRCGFPNIFTRDDLRHVCDSESDSSSAYMLLDAIPAALRKDECGKQSEPHYSNISERVSKKATSIPSLAVPQAFPSQTPHTQPRPLQTHMSSTTLMRKPQTMVPISIDEGKKKQVSQPNLTEMRAEHYGSLKRQRNGGPVQHYGSFKRPEKVHSKPLRSESFVTLRLDKEVDLRRIPITDLQLKAFTNKPPHDLHKPMPCKTTKKIESPRKNLKSHTNFGHHQHVTDKVEQKVQDFPPFSERDSPDGQDWQPSYVNLEDAQISALVATLREREESNTFWRPQTLNKEPSLTDLLGKYKEETFWKPQTIESPVDRMKRQVSHAKTTSISEFMKFGIEKTTAPTQESIQVSKLRRTTSMIDLTSISDDEIDPGDRESPHGCSASDNSLDEHCTACIVMGRNNCNYHGQYLDMEIKAHKVANIDKVGNKTKKPKPAHRAPPLENRDKTTKESDPKDNKSATATFYSSSSEFSDSAITVIERNIKNMTLVADDKYESFSSDLVTLIPDKEQYTAADNPIYLKSNLFSLSDTIDDTHAEINDDTTTWNSHVWNALVRTNSLYTNSPNSTRGVSGSPLLKTPRQRKSKRKVLSSTPAKCMCNCRKKNKYINVSMCSNRSTRSLNNSYVKRGIRKKFKDLQNEGLVKLAVYINAGLLTVHVIGAKGLRSSDGRKCNPYIKLSPIPKMGPQAYCRTKLKRNTNRPSYDEKFSFELSSSLMDKRLLVSVWNRVPDKRRSQLVGCMSFGVRHLIRKEINGWYRLLDRKLGRKLHCSVKARNVKKTSHAKMAEVDQVSQADTDIDEIEEEDYPGRQHNQSHDSSGSGRTPYTTTVEFERGENGFGFSVAWTHPPRIEAVEPGAPADRAGLRVGDFIIFVGTRNVVKMNKDDVLELFRSLTEKNRTFVDVVSRGVTSCGAQTKSTNRLVLELYRRAPSTATTPTPSASPALQNRSNLMPDQKYNTSMHLSIPRSRSAISLSFKTEEERLARQKRLVHRLLHEEQAFSIAVEGVAKQLRKHNFESPTFSDDVDSIAWDLEKIGEISQRIVSSMVEQAGLANGEAVIAIYASEILEMEGVYTPYIKENSKAAGIVENIMNADGCSESRTDYCPLRHLHRLRRTLEKIKEVLQSSDSQESIEMIVRSLEGIEEKAVGSTGVINRAFSYSKFSAPESLEQVPVLTGNMWIVDGMKTKMCWAALYSDTLVLSKYCGKPVELNESNLQIDEITKFESVENRIMLVNLHRAYFNIKKRATEIRLIVKSPRTGIFQRTRKVLTLRAANEQEKNAWQAAIHQQLSELMLCKEKRKHFPVLQRRLSKLRSSFSRRDQQQSQEETVQSQPAASDSNHDSYDDASTMPIDDMDFSSVSGANIRRLPEVVITSELDALSDVSDEDVEIGQTCYTTDQPASEVIHDQTGSNSTYEADWTSNNLQNDSDRIVTDNYLEDNFAHSTEVESELGDRDQWLESPHHSINDDYQHRLASGQIGQTSKAGSTEYRRSDSCDTASSQPRYNSIPSVSEEDDENQNTDFVQQVLSSFEDIGKEVESLQDEQESPDVYPSTSYPFESTSSRRPYDENDHEELVFVPANKQRDGKRVAFTDKPQAFNVSQYSKPALPKGKGLVNETAKFFEEIKRIEEEESAKEMPRKTQTPKKQSTTSKPVFVPAEIPKQIPRSVSYPPTDPADSEPEFDCTGLSIKERLQILKAEPAKSFIKRVESPMPHCRRSPVRRKAPRPVSAPAYSKQNSVASSRGSRGSIRNVGKRLEKARSSFNSRFGRRSPGDGSEIDETPKVPTKRQMSVESERSLTVSGSYCSRQNSRSSRMSRHASLEDNYRPKLNKKYSKRRSWATSAKRIISIQSSLSNLSSAPINLGKNAAEYISKSLSDVSRKAIDVSTVILRKDSPAPKVPVPRVRPEPCSPQPLNRAQPSLRTVKEFQDKLYNPQGGTRKKKMAPLIPIECATQVRSSGRSRNQSPLLRASERVRNFRRNFNSFREDLRRLAVNYHNYRLSRSSPLPPSVKPTPAEARKWAESFDKLIESKYGCALFRAFLKREFSDENLDFWIAIEKYKQLPDDKLYEKAIRIYDEFVAEQSTREVNLDAEIRRSLHKSCSNLTPESATRDLFSLAQRRIAAMLLNDAYPRFLQSQLYKELLDPNSSSAQPSLFSL